EPVKQVRMANLAMVGSHAVNGVSALHSDLLRSRVMKDFSDIFPDRFLNVTNGITPRRWLLMCNPGLANIITARIGDGWVRNLEELRKLEDFAEDATFRQEFRRVKAENKRKLADYILETTGQVVHPDSLFDVQIKRLHMYKRQLLNAMHIIAQYYQILDNPRQHFVPRTFIFSAKAAPSYHIAKLVIKLLNNLGEVINSDSRVAGRMKVIFLPNYNVTLAEKIIPASDLSEQISTAGLEASGTGNMKLALNGALTVGTWDGANIEIAQHVGEENIFIFGKRVEELDAIKRTGYNPWDYYNNDELLRRVLDSLKGRMFSSDEPGLFSELFNELTYHGDAFYYMTDFRSYMDIQQDISSLYENQDEWTKKAILNVARMGWFSSDRSIGEYAEKIWGVKGRPINLADHK
ncbi:MAG: glycogen/starch/alpha-glucan family phosphorylase, partial [Kiritimatiellae bacterium]|nr:glycogen/starch/alpha-glucan family phosphorylase [Kiritimatiellia bacterium]